MVKEVLQGSLVGYSFRPFAVRSPYDRNVEGRRVSRPRTRLVGPRLGRSFARASAPFGSRPIAVARQPAGGSAGGGLLRVEVEFPRHARRLLRLDRPPEDVGARTLVRGLGGAVSVTALRTCLGTVPIAWRSVARVTMVGPRHDMAGSCVGHRRVQGENGGPGRHVRDTADHRTRPFKGCRPRGPVDDGHHAGRWRLTRNRPPRFGHAVRPHAVPDIRGRIGERIALIVAST